MDAASTTSSSYPALGADEAATMAPSSGFRPDMTHATNRLQSKASVSGTMDAITTLSFSSLQLDEINNAETLPSSSSESGTLDAATSLPNELWLEVLGQLSSLDLKALRLTGDRHLQTLASSLLYTKAYVAARRGVLDTFTNLTTHPIFRNHIKEVVFDCSWIDPETVATYAERKCGPPLAEIFQEQEDIQFNELKGRLEDAFRCMTGVKKVTYADLARIACLPGDSNNPSWNCDYLDGPLFRRIFKSSLRRRETGRCCLREEKCSCRCPQHGYRFRRQYGGFLVLMQILSKFATSTLEQLSLGNGVYASGDMVRLPGHPPTTYKIGPQNGEIIHWVFLSAGEPQLFLPAFRCLRKLDLHIAFINIKRIRNGKCPNITAKTRKEFLEVGYLERCLRSAEKLEELNLAGEYDTAHLCLADTLPTHTWTRLRLLHLKHFEADIQELIDFLYRHESSLQHVTLDHFNLLSGTWSELLTAVQTKTSRLELIIGFVWTDGLPTIIDNSFSLPTLTISSPGDDLDSNEGSGEDEVDEDDADKSDADRNDEDENAEESNLEDSNDEELSDEDEKESLCGDPDWEDRSISDEFEELDYSSDDSSPETDEPRRKRDIDLLTTLDPKLLGKVERLRTQMPELSVSDCKHVLLKQKGDYHEAWCILRKYAGYDDYLYERQKIFMGGRDPKEVEAENFRAWWKLSH
ncbi:hypothetical protein MMC28_004845 [Mycoblastus sanguinarius]|nr:hypothetical protein [Mycoblastus sanguinarius]